MSKFFENIVAFLKKHKEIIVPSTVLFVICIVATVLLGVTNFFTKDIIEKIDAQTQETAMQEVLPADKYSKTEGKEIYIAEKNGAVAGYIFVTSEKGYGGDIKVMTAVDPAGKILAVTILSAGDETPGLGQNVTRDKFYSQFIGMKEEITVVKNGANSSNNEINAVTGATISSKAVTKAVNGAIKLYNENFSAGALARSAEQEVTVNE